LNAHNDPPPLQFAPSLQPNDLVAVIAPAGPFAPERLDAGERIWRAHGFAVHRHDNIFLKERYLAGGDRERAAVINEALRDERIKALICARGGYGSLRLLDLIDVEALRQTPKIIVGFSDVTALQMDLRRRLGLVTFSGPMIAGTQIDRLSPAQLDAYFAALTSTAPPSPLSGADARWVKSGAAQGPLLGGNLTLLGQLAIAGRLPSLNGAVLLIEDVNEPPYRLDRLLTTLRMGGHLDGVAAVAVGNFGETIDAAETDRLLIDCLGELNVPLLAGLDFGHHGHNRMIPLGVRVSLDAVAPQIVFTQGGVC